MLVYAHYHSLWIGCVLLQGNTGSIEHGVRLPNIKETLHRRMSTKECVSILQSWIIFVMENESFVPTTYVYPLACAKVRLEEQNYNKKTAERNVNSFHLRKNRLPSFEP